MDDNLRLMLDASSDLLDIIQRETTKLDIVMSALYEQADDDTTDPEIPGMLADAARHAKQSVDGLVAFADYLHDIGKELL